MAGGIFGGILFSKASEASKSARFGALSQLKIAMHLHSHRKQKKPPIGGFFVRAFQTPNFKECILYLSALRLKWAAASTSPALSGFLKKVHADLVFGPEFWRSSGPTGQAGCATIHGSRPCESSQPHPSRAAVLQAGTDPPTMAPSVWGNHACSHIRSLESSARGHLLSASCSGLVVSCSSSIRPMSVGVQE